MRAALRLLTALPVRAAAGDRTEPRARTLVAFPAVGALIGLAWAAAAVTDIVLPNTFLVAAVVLVVDALITGGRPLEALVRVLGRADTGGAAANGTAAGGAAAGGTSPRGTVAVALVTVVRLGALAGLLGFPAFPLLLAVAPVVGRWSVVLLLALAPVTDGTGEASLLGRPSGNVVVGASVVAAALAGALDVRSLAVLPLGFAAAFGIAAVTRRQGRELTPDDLAAGALLAETAALLGLAALLDFLVRS